MVQYDNLVFALNENKVSCVDSKFLFQNKHPSKDHLPLYNSPISMLHISFSHCATANTVLISYSTLSWGD